jgi:subtilase family serine protease
MKSNKIFGLILAFALLVGAAGMLPSTASAGMVPLLVKGPLAGPALFPAGGGSPVYTCQTGQASWVCYDPFQIRHAYGVDQLIAGRYAGQGRTIVIIDAYQSPYLPDDLDAFDAAYGLPARSTGFFTQVAPDGLTAFDPNDDDMVGWSEEITLDVEWAHAIAPGAHIVLVLSKSDDDTDILSATQYAVDQNLGDVISQSFGGNESCDPATLVAEHTVFMNATNKGMTIFASTGDEGAAQPTCDYLSWTRAASSPASDPLVTAVGGTELYAANYCLALAGCNPATHLLPGTYQSEVGWNELDLVNLDPGGNIASGGGYSLFFKKPPYQVGSGLVSGKRGVPDVSYNAAVNHGVLVFYDYSHFGGPWTFGGTSAGTPQWAAITAIADQKAGHRLGFINGVLYGSEHSKSYLKTFHDIKMGSNTVIRLDASNNPVFVKGFNATPLWDADTGLGSPNAPIVVDLLVRYGTNYALSAFSALNPLESSNSTSGTGVMRPH